MSGQVTCASGFCNLELSDAKFLLLSEARLEWEPRKLREPLRRNWLLEWRLPLCLQLPERLDDSWLLLREIPSHTTLSMQLLLLRKHLPQLGAGPLGLAPLHGHASTPVQLPGNSDKPRLFLDTAQFL